MERKEIENCPRYFIYQDGRVFGRHNKFLRPRLTKNGYLAVYLCGKNYTIHRLVAISFLPREYPLNEVNHKDYDKTNNHISNLEWVTHAQNMQSAHKDNKFPKGSEVNTAKLNENKVKKIRELLRTGKVNKAEIGRRFNVSPSTIRSIEIRQSWAHVV